MMEEADINGDGFVDTDEFIKIMLQTNLFWENLRDPLHAKSCFKIIVVFMPKEGLADMVPTIKYHLWRQQSTIL